MKIVSQDRFGKNMTLDILFSIKNGFIFFTKSIKCVNLVAKYAFPCNEHANYALGQK